MEPIVIRYPVLKRLLFVVLAVAFPVYVAATTVLQGVHPPPGLWAIYAIVEGLLLVGVVSVSRFAIRIDDEEILFRELVTKRVALGQVLAVRVEKGKRSPPFYTRRTLVGLAGIGFDGRLVAINVEWEGAEIVPLIDRLHETLPGKVVVLQRF